MSFEFHENVEHVNPDAHGSVFKRIWRPFIILFLITALEFLIAFTMTNPETKGLKVAIFIILTIVKAFYIVAYFMHLKFERINLIYTIVLPFLFLIYLVTLLLVEGDFVNKHVYSDEKTQSVSQKPAPASH